MRPAKPKIARRPVSLLVSMAVVLLLSGCEFYNVIPSSLVSTVANLAPIDAAVVMATDKTVADHAVSFSSGKDCSTVRREQGRTYCAEDELNPRPDVVCFKTLGDITCYSKDDPSLPQGKQIASDQY
ncbi:MAG: hypothetical protein KAI73_09365 [Rhodospirillaceae bacterium]|nr:hypothetical protein [Rhodospirillaceae bacterium]